METLVKKLIDLKEKEFAVQMADHWSRDDYEFIAKNRTEQRDVTERIKEMAMLFLQANCKKSFQAATEIVSEITDWTTMSEEKLVTYGN